MAIKVPNQNTITLKRKPKGPEWIAFKLFVNNSVLYELIKIIHREFIVKSVGLTDSVGVKWKPLKKSTVSWKLKKKITLDRVTLGIYDLASRTALSAAELREFNRKFKAMLGRNLKMKAGERRVQSRKKALKSTRNLSDDDDSKRVPINIRTGKLERALRPNRFMNDKYVPGPNQVIHVSSTSIDFWVTIEYADEVNSVRPFMYADIEPWLEEAVAASVPRIQAYAKSHGYA